MTSPENRTMAKAAKSMLTVICGNPAVETDGTSAHEPAVNDAVAAGEVGMLPAAGHCSISTKHGPGTWSFLRSTPSSRTLVASIAPVAVLRLEIVLFGLVIVFDSPTKMVSIVARLVASSEAP